MTFGAVFLLVLVGLFLWLLHYVVTSIVKSRGRK